MAMMVTEGDLPIKRIVYIEWNPDEGFGGL